MDVEMRVPTYMGKKKEKEQMEILFQENVEAWREWKMILYNYFISIFYESFVIILCSYFFFILFLTDKKEKNLSQKLS